MTTKELDTKKMMVEIKADLKKRFLQKVNDIRLSMIASDIKECFLSRIIVVVMIILVEAMMFYSLISTPISLYSWEIAGIIMVYMLGGGVYVLRMIGKRVEDLKYHLAQALLEENRK